jgi:hypothetical protein
VAMVSRRRVGPIIATGAVVACARAAAT